MSARSSSSSHERCRNSTSGTSGSRRSRTASSSRLRLGRLHEARVVLQEDPAELPGQLERLERRAELGERLVGLLGRLVPRHRRVRLDVEDELGRRALRPAPGHRGVGEVVVGRVDLDRVEALRVVARAAPSSVETPRGYQALTRPSSAKLARAEADGRGHPEKRKGPAGARPPTSCERYFFARPALRGEPVDRRVHARDRADERLQLRADLRCRPAGCDRVGAEERPAFALNVNVAVRRDPRPADAS